MTTDERLAADYAGTGLTTGPHPMAYHRAALRSEGIVAADELIHCANNRSVRVAGCVIARQRPGTAKGFVFLSLEDETGIANMIIAPDVFERDRIIVTRSRFLRIEGPLQNQDGVIHVKGAANHTARHYQRRYPLPRLPLSASTQVGSMVREIPPKFRRSKSLNTGRLAGTGSRLGNDWTGVSCTYHTC